MCAAADLDCIFRNVVTEEPDSSMFDSTFRAGLVGIYASKQTVAWFRHWTSDQKVFSLTPTFARLLLLGPIKPQMFRLCTVTVMLLWIKVSAKC